MGTYGRKQAGARGTTHCAERAPREGRKPAYGSSHRRARLRQKAAVKASSISRIYYMWAAHSHRGNTVLAEGSPRRSSLMLVP